MNGIERLEYKPYKYEHGLLMVRQATSDTEHKFDSIWNLVYEQVAIRGGVLVNFETSTINARVR